MGELVTRQHARHAAQFSSCSSTYPDTQPTGHPRRFRIVCGSFEACSGGRINHMAHACMRDKLTCDSRPISYHCAAALRNPCIVDLVSAFIRTCQLLTTNILATLYRPFLWNKPAQLYPSSDQRHRLRKEYSNRQFACHRLASFGRHAVTSHLSVDPTSVFSAKPL